MLFLFTALTVAAQVTEGDRTRMPADRPDSPDKETAERPPLKDRIFVGGGFGAWFSQTFSFVEVSPMLGYMITPRLSGGVGITYQFVSRTYYNYTTNSDFTNNSHIYGGRLFGRAQLFGPLFAYTEFESISFEVYNPGSNRFQREWVPGLMLGGGLMQPMGQKGGVAITVMYNVIYDSMRSPYVSPVIYRISFFI